MYEYTCFCAVDFKGKEKTSEGLEKNQHCLSSKYTDLRNKLMSPRFGKA